MSVTKEIYSAIKSLFQNYDIHSIGYLPVEKQLLTKLDRPSVHRMTKVSDVLIENCTLTGKNRDDLLINSGWLKRISISFSSNSSCFINVYFDDCTFKNSSISNAVFINCKLDNNVFELNTLTNITFIGCEFDECVVNNTSIKNMTMINCNKEGILFSDFSVEDNPEIVVIQDDQLSSFLKLEAKCDLKKQEEKKESINSQVEEIAMELYEKMNYNQDPDMDKKHFVECSFQSFTVNSVIYNYETEYESCNFLSVIFNGCIFKEVIFDGSIMEKCSFLNCTFTRCSFVDCDLSNSIFREDSFYKCNFLGAKTPDNMTTNNKFEKCNVVLVENDKSTTRLSTLGNIQDVQKNLAEIISFLSSTEYEKSIEKKIEEEDVVNYFKSLGTTGAMMLAAKMLNPDLYKNSSNNNTSNNDNGLM